MCGHCLSAYSAGSSKGFKSALIFAIHLWQIDDILKSGLSFSSSDFMHNLNVVVLSVKHTWQWRCAIDFMQKFVHAASKVYTYIVARGRRTYQE